MSKAATKEKTQTRGRKPVAETVAVAEAVAVVETAPVEAPSDHAHRWRIETPDGEFSRGTCKICGAEKMFPNSAEDYLWEREVPKSRWTGRSEYRAPVNEGF